MALMIAICRSAAILLALAGWYNQSVLQAGERSTALPAPTDYTLNPIVHADESSAGPQRIVSIAPSITEMCAALGLADRIVGRTQYCTHPPAVQGAAVIGAYADANFEKILALKPDIVLITDSSPKLEDDLKKLRLRFQTIPDNTLDDVYTAAEKIGELVQRPKTAQTLIEHLREDLARLSQRAGGHPSFKVLFTHFPLPSQPEPIYIVGPGGYLDSLLSLAGYRNAAADQLSKEWGMLSVEAILAAKPDYILEVRPEAEKFDVQQLYQGWAALESVPAIKHKRIRSLRNTAIAKPGPRINIALHEIISVLAEP